jgi:hypothetical protein
MNSLSEDDNMFYLLSIFLNLLFTLFSYVRQFGLGLVMSTYDIYSLTHSINYCNMLCVSIVAVGQKF